MHILHPFLIIFFLLQRITAIKTSDQSKLMHSNVVAEKIVSNKRLLDYENTHNELHSKKRQRTKGSSRRLYTPDKPIENSDSWKKIPIRRNRTHNSSDSDDEFVLTRSTKKLKKQLMHA